MFLVTKIRKNISLCIKSVNLLLIGEEERIHYVLIKDINTFMYDHTLHRGRKHFCCYCLQAFSIEEILKRHIKDCFKINIKQRIIMRKKVKVTFENFKEGLSSKEKFFYS